MLISIFPATLSVGGKRRKAVPRVFFFSLSESCNELRMLRWKCCTCFFLYHPSFSVFDKRVLFLFLFPSSLPPSRLHPFLCSIVCVSRDVFPYRSISTELFYPFPKLKFSCALSISTFGAVKIMERCCGGLPARGQKRAKVPHVHCDVLLEKKLEQH